MKLSFHFGLVFEPSVVRKGRYIMHLKLCKQSRMDRLFSVEKKVEKRINEDKIKLACEIIMVLSL